ncbi:MAG: hypothetical protein JSS53_08240 [Proteobacteria bacterium]|nr:hypothetical protein [Pseudomonadota bacterium]
MSNLNKIVLLLKKYYNQKQVNRKNDQFDVGDFYVELTLVTAKEQRSYENNKLAMLEGAHKETDPSSAKERQVQPFDDIYENSPSVELKNIIFNARGDQLDDRCRSILISGRPGIGKSRLLERIASEWSIGRLWEKEIDALFRIRDFIVSPSKVPNCL